MMAGDCEGLDFFGSFLVQAKKNKEEFFLPAPHPPQLNYTEFFEEKN